MKYEWKHVIYGIIFFLLGIVCAVSFFIITTAQVEGEVVDNPQYIGTFKIPSNCKFSEWGYNYCRYVNVNIENVVFELIADDDNLTIEGYELDYCYYPDIKCFYR